jgi:hypothetical protein
MRSEPYCTGRCRHGISCGRSRCAAIKLSSTSAGWLVRVAQAGNALDFGDAVEQTAERPLGGVGSHTVVGVHVLPDERDLAHARGRETSHFGHDLRDRTRHLGAAGIRHHAKGTEPVAALLDRDEGRDAARSDRFTARGREKIELSSTGNSVSTTRPPRAT